MYDPPCEFLLFDLANNNPENENDWNLGIGI